jgi:hypothetical protein
MAQNNQFDETIAVVSFDEFNPSTMVGFNKVKLNKAGGKNVGITNKHKKQTLFVSAPLMTSWGIKKYVAEDTGKTSYEMQLQFPQKGSQYDTEEEQEFLEKMKEFEAVVKEHVRQNCRELMNKPKLSEEGMDLLWNPMFRYPMKDVGGGLKEPDYDRAPTMKVKVGFWADKWDDKLEIYDLQENLLFPNSADPSMTPDQLIPEGGATKTAVCIKCGGIYFASGKCGVTWRLHQAIVKPKPKMGGKCLVKLPASVAARMEEDDEQVVEEKPSKVQATIVDDSDDEDGGAAEEEHDEDDVAEVEPEPTPAPAPVPEKKKKVIKKKSG